MTEEITEVLESLPGVGIKTEICILLYHNVTFVYLCLYTCICIYIYLYLSLNSFLVISLWKIPESGTFGQCLCTS